MNISAEQNKAVGEIVDLVAGVVGGANREIHPETAIASCAVLAGSLLLRSFNFELSKQEPGSVLLSNEANEKGPELFNLLGSFLSNSGISLDKSKLGGDISFRGAESKLTLLQSLELLQGGAIEIAKKHNLSFEQIAFSAGVATAFIVKECVKNIGGEIGFNVAAYGFIQGSKTIPPCLESEKLKSSSNQKKPWFKFW